MSSASAYEIHLHKLYLAELRRLEREEDERHRNEAQKSLLIETEKTRAILERLGKEKEKKQTRTTTQEEQKLEDIEKKLLKDKILTKAERITTGVSHSADKKTEEVILKLQSIEQKISTIDHVLYKLMEREIKDIAGSTEAIKDKIQGNYAYFESNLKWLNIRLNEVIEAGKKKLEEMEKRAIELLTDIEIIIKSPHIHDKERALGPRRELEAAFSCVDIARLMTAIETLTPEIKMLYNQHLEMERSNKERQYIMDDIQGVLTQMGYNVSRLSYRAAENPKAPLFMEFDIPGGEGVKLGFDLNKGAVADVFHDEKEGDFDRKRFKTQEKKWCSDIDKIKAKLKKKGIDFEEKWREDLTEEEIKMIEVKSRAGKKEEEYRRRAIHEQKKMQRQ